jgi:cytochrome c
MAAKGNTIYVSRCSSCHGSNGEGITAPPLWGATASLQNYGDASQLLLFIKTAMPMDAPGSLPPEEYQQVLCLLLLRNQFTPGNTPFSADKLVNISFPK